MRVVERVPALGWFALGLLFALGLEHVPFGPPNEAFAIVASGCVRVRRLSAGAHHGALLMLPSGRALFVFALWVAYSALVGALCSGQVP
jgi:hypothetical protein